MTPLKTPKGWPSILLGRAGAYDPEGGLASAERAGAWSAWQQVAGRTAPEALIRMVEEAGLRGRGGAGYPTAAKWRACRAAPGERHIVVANGYEADPGAVMDRALMELDPHAVVEGTALAAYAVGAEEAYIAVRADASAAADGLRAAIRVAEEAGYIGSDVTGRGSRVHVEVRPVPGGFLVGEETTLLRALEGKRGMPEQRPPYPAVRGLHDQPTVVNNVATLAAVPWIVSHGAAAFAAAGDPACPGSLLVQLSGAIKKPGLAEVPTGTRLGEIVQRVGGGASGKLKAVLVGGPSGGFLPAAALDTPLSFGPIGAAGAIIGSGSLVVVDESACIVELATTLERFMNDESCGKCIPCRIGTKRLAEIGDRFVGGRPRPTDVQLLADLSEDVRDGSLCGHGITAPNPLTSGMRYFEDEFQDHIVRGRCPAGVCTPLRVKAAALTVS
ncbi:MAG: complex I 51 kDa subunit family protein [Candidatus Limnocylindrales bacterium]